MRFAAIAALLSVPTLSAAQVPGASGQIQDSGPVGDASGDLRLNGAYKLTLDADDNSYFYSSADNVLDWYLSGAAEMQLTSTWLSNGGAYRSAAGGSTSTTSIYFGDCFSTLAAGSGASGAGGFFGCTQLTDTFPSPLYIMPQMSAPDGATSTAGTNIVLVPSMGVRRAAMTAANCAADTVTITINGIASVGTVGTEFACAGANAACATSLASWANGLTGIDACAGSACEFVGTDGTAYIYPDPTEVTVAQVPGAHTLTLATSDATCAAITSGTTGKVSIRGDSTSTGPMLVLGATNATGAGMKQDGTAVHFRTGADGADTNAIGLMFRMTGIVADLGATCTLGDWGYDTGGVADEICFCAATDTWMCSAATAGPAD